MTDLAPPDGYAPHFRKSRFTDPWEPLYSRTGPREVSIGVYLSDAHCNSRGLVHGGLIASLADNAMGLSCMTALAAEGRAPTGGLVTITLNTDYLGSARIGQWLATETSFVKTGGSICFASCLVHADGEAIARANASFKVLQAKA